MNEQDREEAPLAALRGLARERSPERDLWPGIERRLRRRSWVPLALAAGLLVTFGSLLSVRLLAPSENAAVLALDTQDRVLIEAHLQIAHDAERQLQAALGDRPESDELHNLLALARRHQAYLQQLLS